MNELMCFYNQVYTEIYTQDQGRQVSFSSVFHLVSSDRYLLGTYYVPGNVLGSGDTVVNTTNKPLTAEFMDWWGDRHTVTA